MAFVQSFTRRPHHAIRIRPSRRLRIEPLEQRTVLANGVGFAEPTAYPVGNNPEGLASADLDADGILDLVTANFADNSVSVLMGNGDGTFEPAVDYGTEVTPTAVALADVNRDGSPDIITANFTANNVSVLFQLLDGSFGFERTFDVGVEPFSVTAADVNSDRRIDLIVPHTGVPGVPGGISILHGDGSGNFEPAVEIGEGMRPTSVAVADLNDDRRLDIAAANGFLFGGPDNNDIAVFLGGATRGTFLEPVRYAAGDGPTDIEIADVNSDGAPDLVTVNELSGNVSVLLGDGDGTFGSASNYAAGQRPNSLAVSDFNGNGHLDIAVANGNSNDISILVNRTDGRFVPQGRFASGNSPLSIVAGFFDEDQLPDLAVVTQEPDEVLVLLNTGAGPGESVILEGRGTVYEQDFDLALGIEGGEAGTLLPGGWSAVIGNDTNTAITQSFPAGNVVDGVYNAGRVGSFDRALATAVTAADRQQQLQFLAEVTGGDVSAVRLAFDIEAWDADVSLAADPGEAAFNVVMEADTGTGFQAVVDFGLVTSGTTLHPSPPPIGRELWKTDGTNVSLVADLVPGEQGSAPRGFAEFHDELYFLAGEGFTPTVVKYDGSSLSDLADDLEFRNGPTEFDDALYYFPDFSRFVLKIDDGGISTIAVSSDPSLRFRGPQPFEFNGELFFGAWLNRTGIELWKYDGTEFVMVEDINPHGNVDDACGGSDPADFTVFDNELYFTAAGDFVGPIISCPRARAARELWKLDGAVPIEVADIFPGRRGSDPLELSVFNGELYFYANDGTTGYELWKFDGDTARQLADIRPGPEGAFGNLNKYGDFDAYGGQFTEFENELYFVANDGQTGWELWKTDGASVTRVTDVNTGTGDSIPTGRSFYPIPRNLIVYNDELYFAVAAEDGTNELGVWKTNGVNLLPVADLNPEGDPIPGVRGTPDRFWNFFVFNDELYFAANDGTSGREIWKTDGTDTTQVTDINIGPGDSVLRYHEFVEFKGELFFDADNGSGGSGLFDGNAPANHVHFDSGVLDVEMPTGAELRLRFDARNTGATTGYVYGLDNVQLRLLAAGDSDGNGQFDQTDIVTVLQASKYLTGQPATFAEGDWNRDGVFNQLDIVAALEANNYLQGPYALVVAREDSAGLANGEDFDPQVLVTWVKPVGQLEQTKLN